MLKEPVLKELGFFLRYRNEIFARMWSALWFLNSTTRFSISESAEARVRITNAVFDYDVSTLAELIFTIEFTAKSILGSTSR